MACSLHSIGCHQGNKATMPQPLTQGKLLSHTWTKLFKLYLESASKVLRKPQSIGLVMEKGA